MQTEYKDSDIVSMYKVEETENPVYSTCKI